MSFQVMCSTPLKKYYLILSIFLYLFSFSVFSASFNCQRAKTQIEHRICNNKQLSQLDSQLGTVYKKTRKSLPPKDQQQLRQAQRTWLALREQHCVAADLLCLTHMYQLRIRTLSSWKKPLKPIKKVEQNKNSSKAVHNPTQTPSTRIPLKVFRNYKFSTCIPQNSIGQLPIKNAEGEGVIFYTYPHVTAKTMNIHIFFANAQKTRNEAKIYLQRVHKENGWNTIHHAPPLAFKWVTDYWGYAEQKKTIGIVMVGEGKTGIFTAIVSCPAGLKQQCMYYFTPILKHLSPTNIGTTSCS